MMTRILVALLLTGLVCFAADVTGKWTGQVPTRGGEMRDQTLNLKSDGSTVTGTVSGGRGGDVEIKEGKISGDDVSFVVVRSFGGNEIRQNYKGKVAGNEIKFNVSMGERSYDFVAKKAQ